MITSEVFFKYGFSFSEKYSGYEKKETFFGHIIIFKRRQIFSCSFMSNKNFKKREDVFHNKNRIIPICNESMAEVLEETLNNLLYMSNSKLANSLLNE